MIMSVTSTVGFTAFRTSSTSQLLPITKSISQFLLSHKA